MINDLIQLIGDYLDGHSVDIPKNYATITEENNFYHFLEDYLLDNWDDVVTVETYDLIDELPELCAETEPNKDTTEMDIELRKLYNELVERLNN